MAPLALFNEGAPGYFFHLQDVTALIYGGTHDEAPKRKDIAPLAL